MKLMMDVPSGNVQNHKINLKYVRNLLAKIKSPRTRDGNCNQEALNPFVCSRAFDSLFHFALWNLLKELAELKPPSSYGGIRTGKGQVRDQGTRTL